MHKQTGGSVLQVAGTGSTSSGDTEHRTADGLADLVRRAFLPQSPATARQRRSAIDELWTRLAPAVDAMSMRVCRSSHPSLRCAGPGRCHQIWCERAQEYLVGELLNPERPRSLARRIADDPKATDEEVAHWVADLDGALWSEIRRALLRDRSLNQRVDVWLRDSPHRACLQELLDEELGDDHALLATFGPTTIRDWAEAFAVDAVQWSADFPDCNRVLRFLGRKDHGRALNRVGERDLARAHVAVRRVESAFRNYDEAACIRCGGQPKLDAAARVATAQIALDAMPDADRDAMVNAGNALIDDEGRTQVVEGRAGRILLFVDPPRTATVADGERTPPWFTRFVLEPRTSFLEGRPAGAAINSLVDAGQRNDPGAENDG